MARQINRARAKQSAGLLIAGGVLMLAGSAVAVTASEWLQAAIALVVGAYFLGMGVQRWRDADELD